MKTANAERKVWVDVLAEVFWADRMTVQKSTGYSAYYMVHGVEPLMPYNISEVTYMTPEVKELVPTSELIARCCKAWGRPGLRP